MYLASESLSFPFQGFMSILLSIWKYCLQQTWRIYLLPLYRKSAVGKRTPTGAGPGGVSMGDISKQAALSGDEGQPEDSKIETMVQK